MRWKLLRRGAAAMIVGYAVIVVLTVFGFSVLLSGRSFYGGSALLLMTGMMVAVVAGLTGGYVTGRVGRARLSLTWPAKSRFQPNETRPGSAGQFQGAATSRLPIWPSSATGKSPLLAMQPPERSSARPGAGRIPMIASA